MENNNVLSVQWHPKLLLPYSLGGRYRKFPQAHKEDCGEPFHCIDTITLVCAELNTFIHKNRGGFSEGKKA